jgi:enoyl-[acyl-carrier protein] reductase I
MLSIDLSGKRALVAGVADDGGFGFAIAKAFAMAGASVCVGTWPPALGIFQTLLRRGKLDASLTLGDGRKMEFERVLPLDAEYDVLADAPAEVRENKRYKDLGDFSIQGCADRLRADFGEACVDIVVHSLANGPEVTKDLLATSRRGYLGASSVSAYSMVSLVQRFGPMMRPHGAFLSLSYLASERVNCLSAGPFASRAASAIGAGKTEAEEGESKRVPFIEQMIEYARVNSPLPEAVSATDVGGAAAFLCSPLAAGITGCVVHVDKGYHAMGKAVENTAF